MGGTVVMTGGTISGNTATRYGGGVCNKNNGTFTMTGGTISGNSGTSTSSLGGGFYLDSGKLHVSGSPTITGNTVKNAASNVYLSQARTITLDSAMTGEGGTITGNQSRNGGGLYNQGGTVVMTGGTISDNTATNNGGGVYSTGIHTFTMTGGTISGNTATGDGGGFYLDSGELHVSGSPTITGNTVNDTDSNVYLSQARTITLDSAMTGGAIGLTSSKAPSETSPTVNVVEAATGYTQTATDAGYCLRLGP